MPVTIRTNELNVRSENGEFLGIDAIAPTQEQLNTWLDAHPEATTTVQDGSLTEAKFSDALKLKAIKDYVTPQMFGAKGDGVADDTEPIQRAINSDKYVVFPKGTYKTFDTIHVNNKSRFAIDASQAMIDYMGSGYAIDFRYCRNCRFQFDYIYARDGGGLNFIADDVNTWSQYINIEFNIINVLTNGINASLTKSGQWINEFRIHKGRFQAGANGVKIETVNGNVSGWHFTNVAFEGATNGVNIVCSSGSVNGYTFLNCRYAESFEKIILTTGEVYRLLFIGTNPIKNSVLQLSEATSGYMVSPFAKANGTLLSGNEATIVKGKPVKENRTEYYLVRSDYSDTTFDLAIIDSLEFPKYLTINNTGVNKLVLPSYAGVANGANDFYFVFTKPVSAGDTFDIEQGGAVIKSFSSHSGEIIHAIWNEQIGWKYLKQTNV